ncbi:MAG: preprotein translocase subunit SecE [Thermomicrobium sp.]|nr:preprotein translocase subunit SecE [Thermomicrobium sp.]MDW8059238.1 preprotein translocase subunit SecE [Thermomicrobium sp.]
MATKTQTQATARSGGKAKAPARPARAWAGRLAGLRRTIADLRAEWKKITWPDRETTRKLTLLVIGLAAVLGLILGAVDALFVRLWNLLGGL